MSECCLPATENNAPVVETAFVSSAAKREVECYINRAMCAPSRQHSSSSLLLKTHTSGQMSLRAVCVAGRLYRPRTSPSSGRNGTGPMRDT